MVGDCREWNSAVGDGKRRFCGEQVARLQADANLLWKERGTKIVAVWVFHGQGTIKVFGRIIGEPRGNDGKPRPKPKFYGSR
jgi:hypothetical protein